MKKKWGSYKVLGQGKDWKVKLLTINPHSKTSLQKHNLRKEIWIYPRFYTTRIAEIRLGRWHQITNKGNKAIQVIEVQIGRCIERDIERK